MSVSVNVNGKAINYPQTGDTNWGDEATNFAVETSAALSKVGLSTGTTVSIPGTLAVTGATTLNSTLSVTGTTSLTGNVTATNNLIVNGNTTLGNANTDTINVNGIVNVDSGTLYVDPNNRVGVNKTNPAQALDVAGNIAISGNETVGGTLNVTGATSLSSTLYVTGNSTLTGNLSVNGNTTLGDASGDSLTINSNDVSIPNGLNFDSNTLVINATDNRVGIGVSSPAVPLDVQANSVGFGINIRGRSSDNAAQLRFNNNAGTLRYSLSLEASSDNFVIYNASSVPSISINQTGQISAVVPSGSTLYPGFLCRAWVNFNGTTASPSTIRGSGNVSSITKNGTGDYTVNFTTAMPDANYSFILNGGLNTSANLCFANITSAPAAGSIRVGSVVSQTAAVVDATNYTVAIFR